MEHTGFRKGHGTRDQIANVRWMMKRVREIQKTVYLCSIDYSKAFDTVQHLKMLNTMKIMGIPEHLTMLVRDLYTEQEAKVQVEQDTTEGSQKKKRVRQTVSYLLAGLIYTMCLIKNETLF